MLEMIDEPVRVAHDYGFPPFAEVKDGKSEGLAVDIFRAAAARAGINVKFVPVSFEQRQLTLADGRADAYFRRRRAKTARLTVHFAAHGGCQSPCRRSLILVTNDNHQIYAAWKGLRHGPKEVMDRLYQGEIVDPGAYYFRTTPYFETSSEKYGWMNRICSIASGSLSANARTLDVFQVLCCSRRIKRPWHKTDQLGRSDSVR